MVFQANGKKKKIWVALSIADEIAIKTHCNMRHRRILNNSNKEVNLGRTYNNFKHMHPTQEQLCI